MVRAAVQRRTLLQWWGRGAAGAELPGVAAWRHVRLCSSRAGEEVEQEVRPSAKALLYPPHSRRFEPTHSVEEYRRTYEGRLEPGGEVDEAVVLCGRVVLRREASRKLLFLVLQQAGHTVQLLCSRRSYGEDGAPADEGDLSFEEVVGSLRRGDVVGARGRPKKSNRGELSMAPAAIRLLAPCLEPLPHYHGLRDQELRYRKRYLELISNRRAHSVFRARAAVTSAVRRRLEESHYVEVETPVLWGEAGGAAATPFVTEHRQEDGGGALGSRPLQLRIAPELFLKELVVGGMDRVFDMGKVFRNEGIDATHNPEFTMCEFYQAHMDYEGMMAFLEPLVRYTAEAAAKAVTHGSEAEHTVEVPDFSAPFQRIEILPALEEALGCTLPDANCNDSAEEWLALCRKHGVRVAAPHTTARAVDKLIGHFLEPRCQSPTFLVNHPLLMSPLAKQHRSIPGVAERFELFINGMEVANGYSELNDPEEQRRRFEQQQQARERGDEECHGKNASFVTALRHGLPPTAGCGIGIDRLVQVLTGTASIRDVILFPLLRPTGEEATGRGTDQ